MSSQTGRFTGRLIVFSIVFALSIRRDLKYIDEDGGLGDVALVTTDTSIVFSQSCVTELVSVEREISSTEVDSDSSRDESSSFELSLVESLDDLSLFVRCEIHLADTSLAVR